MIRYFGLAVFLVAGAVVHEKLNPPPPGRFIKTCVHRVIDCKSERCKLIEEKRRLSPMVKGRDYEDGYTYGVYVR